MVEKPTSRTKAVQKRLFFLIWSKTIQPKALQNTRFIFPYVVQNQPAESCPKKDGFFLILLKIWSKTNQPQLVQKDDFFLYYPKLTSRRLSKDLWIFSCMVEDQPAEGSSKGNMAIFLTWLKDQPTLRLCNHCYTTI